MEKIKTYDKIIFSAFEEFSNSGYNGTSINQIIKKANVSKGALYHYFKSKEDLFLKTIEFFSKQIMNGFSEYIPLTLEDIKNFGFESLKMYKENIQIQKFTLEVMIESSRNNSVKMKLNDLMNMFMNLFENLFKEYKKMGLLKKDTDTKLISQKTFILLDSLGLYISFDFKIEYEKIWNDFIDNELSRYWTK
ncbi:fatty acid metabolism regulator protein [Tepiditoga spiralis]|uniref:Fatty acid metabolism regulator protein n=1 Tax=Tepiditoga spiralis TaxID=2108365 RepID=A0A7G1G8I5_9BACT|nr:TetR/AcrR family transcriptional regulator [Tepiditoga spiralis]BBE31544.1 fatty acid metabolism regulator protein [Tepiditoga spiralis]